MGGLRVLVFTSPPSVRLKGGVVFGKEDPCRGIAALPCESFTVHVDMDGFINSLPQCKYAEAADAGVNEVIASILMVVLVVALAIIIGSIVFGVIVIQPKSAYIPPRVEVVNYSGQQAISLYSRGGDPAILDRGDGVQYALGIYVENSSVASRVTPDTGCGDVWPRPDPVCVFQRKRVQGCIWSTRRNATTNASRPGHTAPGGRECEAACL
jgi:hypothetical protein